KATISTLPTLARLGICLPFAIMPHPMIPTFTVLIRLIPSRQLEVNRSFLAMGDICRLQQFRQLRSILKAERHRSVVQYAVNPLRKRKRLYLRKLARGDPALQRRIRTFGSEP